MTVLFSFISRLPNSVPIPRKNGAEPSVREFRVQRAQFKSSAKLQIGIDVNRAHQSIMLAVGLSDEDVQRGGVKYKCKVTIETHTQ